MAKNYVAHVKEFDSVVPTEPVFFMKHENCIVRNNKPFYFPDFSNDIHYEVEIVLKICKVGKNIDRKFAHQYYDEIGLGIDFTARDLQDEAKQAGMPWEVAKAFDYSAPLSEWVPVQSYKDINDVHFHLNINGKTVQEASTSLMIFPVAEQISYISRFITFKTGDLLFTGTPAGVGPVKVGDRLEAYLEGKKMLDFLIK